MTDQDLALDVGGIFRPGCRQPAVKAHDGLKRRAGTCQLERRGAAKTIADGGEAPVEGSDGRERVERRRGATTPDIDIAA